MGAGSQWVPVNVLAFNFQKTDLGCLAFQLSGWQYSLRWLKLCQFLQMLVSYYGHLNTSLGIKTVYFMLLHTLRYSDAKKVHFVVFKIIFHGVSNMMFIKYVKTDMI